MSRRAVHLVRSLVLLTLVVGSTVSPAVGAGEHTEGEETPPVWFREYQRGGINDAVAVPGGYVLVGDYRPSGGFDPIEAWAAKVDHEGDVVWRRTFNGSDVGILHGVDGAGGGDAIAVGKRDADSESDRGRMWVVRFGADGSVEWERTYGSGELFDVAAKPDGGAVAVGQSWMPFPEGYAVGVDADGDERWSRSLGGEELRAVVPDRSGAGFLLAGTGERDHGSVQGARAMAVWAGGDVRWNRFYGNETEGATTIRTRQDGLVLVGSRTVIRTDHRGVATNVTRLDTVEGDVLTLEEMPDGRTVVGLGTGRRSGGLARLDAAWRVERLVRARNDHPVGRVEAIVPAGDGRYLVAGRASPKYGGSSTGFAYLTDQQRPAARLSTDPTVAETGVTDVTLDASASTDNTAIQYYRWDFDGNGSYDAQSPEPKVTHVYDRLGRVNATVTAIDVDGNRANASVDVTLEDTTPPVARLSAPAPRFVATSAPARLNASGSSDNHRIVEYRWDFDDDGSVDTVTDGPGVRHQFSGEPLQWIELTVVDSVGHVDSTVVTLETAPNDGPPNVTVRSGLAVVGDRTYFEANATDRVGTPTVTWIFPDGTRTTGTVATHVFDRPGKQNVSVVVADEYGAERRKGLTVDVRESYPPDTAGVGLVFVPILFGLLALLGLILVPAFVLALMALASDLRDGGD